MLAEGPSGKANVLGSEVRMHISTGHLHSSLFLEYRGHLMNRQRSSFVEVDYRRHCPPARSRGLILADPPTVRVFSHWTSARRLSGSTDTWSDLAAQDLHPISGMGACLGLISQFIALA
jgi:hypothetical protein